MGGWQESVVCVAGCQVALLLLLLMMMVMIVMMIMVCKAEQLHMGVCCWLCPSSLPPLPLRTMWHEQSSNISSNHLLYVTLQYPTTWTAAQAKHCQGHLHAGRATDIHGRAGKSAGR
jgi:hypothetical protein